MVSKKHFQSVNIRDPIHGFIRLNEFEKELIQTQAFQRLRFIHQLGTSFLVYPTAQHTRFQHSLGVLHLAGRLLDRLELMGIEMSDEDKEVFRVASLLHDIGHAPFSHVGEEMGLFLDGIDHEVMGERIIRQMFKKKIEKELSENAVERIIFIIRGGRPFSLHDTLFHQLLAGQAGIDRMDYLIRDSYFLGVMYGRFDLERLLETLRYDQDKRIIFWEEGGIHALEQFLLARYFMFTEVYFHKTRRILDFHLAEAMKHFLENRSPKGIFPIEPKKYITINDHGVLNWILRNKEFSRIFLKRKFLKRIDSESSDHPNPEEIILWDWLEREIKGHFESCLLFIDNAEKAPYKFEKEDVMVKMEGEKDLTPLEEVSKLVKSLKPIAKRRIYVEEDRRKEVSEFVIGFIEEHKMK